MAVLKSWTRRQASDRVGTFIDHLLDGDAACAEAILAESRSVLTTRVAVIADLFQPALTKIGELWYDGAVGVADEHRATGIVELLLARLEPTPAQERVAQGSACVLAALGDEQHGLGLRALEAAFQDEGWRCVFLGPCTPAEELYRVAEAHPGVVLLSAAYLPEEKPMTAAVAALHRRRRRVMVGGQAFERAPELWRRVGADATAPDARAALVVARRLLNA